MSNSDKTRDKLLNSMRKTKAGSENKETVSESTQNSGETKSQSPKAGGSTRTSASKSPKESTQKAKPKAAPAKRSSADPYQSRGRVWPD